MAHLTEEEMLELFEDPGFETVDITQMGPSGKYVIARLIFRVCPICAAVVPGEVDDRNFAAQHKDWHLGRLTSDG